MSLRADEGLPGVAAPLGPMEIRHDRGRLWLLVAGCGAFALLGGWMWFDVSNQPFPDRLALRAIAGAAVLASMGAAGWFLRRLRDPRPALILTAEALIDRASGVAAGRVPWSEIVDVYATSMNRQTFVTVVVSDPSRYVGRGGFWQRLAQRANARWFDSPIQLPADALDVDLDALLGHIERYRRAAYLPQSGS